MNRLHVVLGRVFDGGTSRSVPEGELREALDAARFGADDGLATLVEGYGPLLMRAVRKYGAVMAADDARTAAALGLWTAVQSCDGELAGTPESFTAIAAACVEASLSEAAAESSAIHVPGRTLRRFFGVLRRAGGDAELAAAIAPEYSLSREAFYAIAEAMRCGSLDVEAVAAAAARVVDAHDELSAIEVRDLVSAAFKATDDTETEVIRAAYGFSDYRPKGDAEVGADFGMSRATAQRVRSRGLGKMREALAVDVEE